jgi:hypothetical protein
MGEMGKAYEFVVVINRRRWEMIVILTNSTGQSPP